MTGGSRLCCPLAVAICLSGCAVPGTSSPSTGPTGRDSPSSLCRVTYQSTASSRESCCPRRGVVFILDGAGGFEVASGTISDTIALANLPLETRTYYWTHGYCRVFSDHMHRTHQLRAGQMLADLVLRCRRESPDQAIYLVAHSAGCAVVLLAADQLPPNTLERIVLLAPAVSAKRDLRRALMSSRKGIDVFVSSHDWCCLGIGILLLGTTDRHWMMPAAGRNGFQPIVTCSEDETLYSKLRQYPWDASLIRTGHKGGHYGSYQPGFLRAFVLPLLQ